MKPTSKKTNKEIKKEIPKHETVIMAAPFGPIFLPNIPAVIEPIKGKKIKFKYPANDKNTKR